VRHVVFSSTCAVYGSPERIPITEQTPREPVNPYGASKLFFENALEAYDRAYGVRSARLRYFNAAGADDSGEIGELHDPETHLIPLALLASTDGARSYKSSATTIHARWHLLARLHPRQRSRRCSCPRAAASGKRRRVVSPQPRHWARKLGPRSYPGGGKGNRPACPPQHRPPPPRRSSNSCCRRQQSKRRLRMDRAARPDQHSQYRMELHASESLATKDTRARFRLGRLRKAPLNPVGTDFSAARSSLSHPSFGAPVINIELPLSAMIIPYCCSAVRITWTAGESRDVVARLQA